MVEVLVQERCSDGSTLMRTGFKFLRVPSIGEWIVVELNGDEEAYLIEEVVQIAAGEHGEAVARVIGKPGMPPR